MDKNQLIGLVEDFLMVPRESDGGWAKVTDEDINELSAILRGLIRLKCQEDPDGDVPIEFELVNRRKKHFILGQWMNTIPYRSMEDEIENFDPLERGGRLATLMNALDSITRAISNEMRIIQYVKSEQK